MGPLYREIGETGRADAKNLPLIHLFICAPATALHIFVVHTARIHLFARVCARARHLPGGGVKAPLRLVTSSVPTILRVWSMTSWFVYKYCVARFVVVIICYCFGSRTHHGRPCNTMFCKQYTCFVQTLSSRDFSNHVLWLVLVTSHISTSYPALGKCCTYFKTEGVYFSRGKHLPN